MAKSAAGEMAPYFEGIDQRGNSISLETLEEGKIILYFYPRDNTSGCTAEACSLRDGKSELEKMGFTIVGVSPDSGKSHAGFAAKHDLNFSLIPDPDHKIAEAYGVWGLKKFMGRESMGMIRTTFIIDETGVIIKVFEKVDTKRHFEQIADWYREFSKRQ